MERDNQDLMAVRGQTPTKGAGVGFADKSMTSSPYKGSPGKRGGPGMSDTDT